VSEIWEVTVDRCTKNPVVKWTRTLWTYWFLQLPFCYIIW